MRYNVVFRSSFFKVEGVGMYKFLKLIHIVFIIVWLGSLILLSTAVKYREKWGMSLADAKKFFRSVYFSFQLPSMILAVLFGLLLFSLSDSNFKAGWFHMKMTAAIGLIGCDIWLGCLLNRATEYTSKQFTIIRVLVWAFFFMALSSIYLVRNKEQEWVKKYEQTFLPWQK